MSFISHILRCSYGNLSISQMLTISWGDFPSCPSIWPRSCSTASNINAQQLSPKPATVPVAATDQRHTESVMAFTRLTRKPWARTGEVFGLKVGDLLDTRMVGFSIMAIVIVSHCNDWNVRASPIPYSIGNVWKGVWLLDLPRLSVIPPFTGIWHIIRIIRCHAWSCMAISKRSTTQAASVRKMPWKKLRYSSWYSVLQSLLLLETGEVKQHCCCHLLQSFILKLCQGRSTLVTWPWHMIRMVAMNFRLLRFLVDGGAAAWHTSNERHQER